MFAFLGKLFAGFLAVVAGLGVIGLAKKETRKKDGKPLPEKIVSNVSDLNDRFNRARYMDKDGK